MIRQGKGPTCTHEMGTNRHMSQISDRLAYLRKRGKLRSKAAAAKAYGIGYEVYKKIDAHNPADPRNLTAEQAKDIAAYHRVSVGWLMFGEGAPDGVNAAPLQGKIGAGQEMMLYDNLDTDGIISTEIASAGSVAFEVEGDSMRPLAHDRDILFVGPERRDIDSLIGVECAVLLEDGRRFFKILEHGPRKGKYDLISYNAAPIRDVAVHSAGPLLGIKRSFPLRRRDRRAA